MVNDAIKEKLLKDVKMDDLRNVSPMTMRTAEFLGIELFARLCLAIGGIPIYLPKIESLLAGPRDRLIMQECDGYNYSELAIKYGVTESWVRQLVNRDRKAKLEENSISLFDDEAVS